MDAVTFPAAELHDLPEIQSFIRQRMEAVHLPSAEIQDMILAVTEIVTNIILYGYTDQSGPIELEVTRKDDRVELLIRDQAKPFNPTEYPMPDTTLPLEQRPAGGLGIFLARNFVDHMIYRFVPNHGNELILVKEFFQEGLSRE